MRVCYLGDVRTKGRTVATVLQQRNIPQAFRALDLADTAVECVLVDTPNYVDLYTTPLPPAPAITAEQLARAAFEDGPALGRFLAWRVALQLPLAPHPWAPWRGEAASAPDYLGGWRITDRGDNWVRIKTSSASLTVFCIFQVDPGLATMATFLRYDRPGGRLRWAAVGRVHRGLALPVLRAGVQRLLRRAAP